MIDIHNHIVYDCDDGSRDLEQSIRMIKAAKEAGFDTICFTPHYMEDGYRSEKQELLDKVETIKRRLAEEQLEMELHLGEEIFIFPDLPEHLDRVVCLNDSKYLLFEIPLMEEISYIDDVVYRLFTLGKVPILAHPERYLATAKDFSFVEKLCEKGVLLQININSLSGHYGKDAKRIATRLLKQDMVHFIGSDAHSSAGYLKVAESVQVLKKLVSEKKVKEITEENPRKVLLNQEIEAKDFKIEKKQKTGLFSAFWKRES
ncbi:MAG: hypothetical protein IJ867_04650 [Clostridia bacterium]|nr:hypothetical protein [Clostridia bacterium]